jgi:dephospho-CoA kinase
MVLVGLFIVGISLPIGTLTKKLFRQYFPSDQLLRNPYRKITLSHNIVGAILLSILIKTMTIIYAKEKLIFYLGVISFLVGWQLSVIGLTGGIASGKSTASTYLKDIHCHVVIDADQIARDLLRKGSSVCREVARVFGPEIFNPITGEIDRKALGNIIFSDKQKKQILERLTHPRIVIQMISEIVINRLRGRVVFMDAPLLFEPSMIPILRIMCFETILIDTGPEERKRRLLLRNPELSPDEVDKRISSQASRNIHLQLADYVVSNEGTVAQLYDSLNKIALQLS